MGWLGFSSHTPKCGDLCNLHIADQTLHSKQWPIQTSSQNLVCSPFLILGHLPHWYHFFRSNKHFQNWDPEIWIRILSSLFSNLSLNSRQMFITLIFMKPIPPKSFGLISPFHNMIFHFLVVPVTKISSTHSTKVFWLQHSPPKSLFWPDQKLPNFTVW